MPVTFILFVAGVAALTVGGVVAAKTENPKTKTWANGLSGAAITLLAVVVIVVLWQAWSPWSISLESK